MFWLGFVVGGVFDCAGGVSFFVGAVDGGSVLVGVVVGVGEGDGGGAAYFGVGVVECCGWGSPLLVRCWLT